MFIVTEYAALTKHSENISLVFIKLRLGVNIKIQNKKLKNQSSAPQNRRKFSYLLHV